MSQGLFRNKLSRRHALLGLGGITLSLPWLEKLNGYAKAQSNASKPKRVIVVSYAMGVPLGEWRPSATGRNFNLPFVTAPLEAFKDRCLFVSSIDNQVLEAGGDSFIFGHPSKKESALTGTLNTSAFGPNNENRLSDVLGGTASDSPANGPSVEHLMGQYLRRSHMFSSVDLAVDGEAHNSQAADSLTSEFFFEGRGNPISMMGRPSAALDRLFAGVVETTTGPTEAQLALQAVRARNKSVLDAVRSSFTDLRQGLGREDQRRLDEHAALIRQLELDTQVSAGCRIPDGVSNGTSMSELSAQMVKILASSMACDLAPVGRLEFTRQDSPRFGVPSLDSLFARSELRNAGYNWHALVHGDPFPGESGARRPGRDGASEYDPQLLEGYRFFVQQFADLLAALDAVQEGPDTTVLDNSLVVLASDLGEGLGHANLKMAYLLAGNLGGATPQHFDATPSSSFAINSSYFYTPSRYTVNQLLHSMLDMVGVVDGSSQPVTMGLQGYLEERGIPRRIDALFG